jgi:hypothetical protein
VYVFAELDLKKNWKGYQYLANRVSKVAKDYAGKAVFALANKADEKWTFSDYGLPDLEGKRDTGMAIKAGDWHYASKVTFLPCVSCCSGGGRRWAQTFPFAFVRAWQDFAFSGDKLKAFVADYFGGKLVGKVCRSRPQDNAPAR